MSDDKTTSTDASGVERGSDDAEHWYNAIHKDKGEAPREGSLVYRRLRPGTKWHKCWLTSGRTLCGNHGFIQAGGGRDDDGTGTVESVCVSCWCESAQW